MDILAEARRVLDVEAKAVLELKDRLGETFLEAVELLFRCQGKIVVSGIGKSGQIGRKIASTMTSTGSLAVFLHPAESSHGDLGLIGAHDVILALSYKGETPEMSDMLQFAARKGLPVVAITGNPRSTLAESANVVLDVSIRQEACPLGLAPTASTTATLAMGDALAMSLLLRRGFKPEDFAEYHPGGSLGRRLLTRVGDIMHTGDALPLVPKTTGMKDVLTLMTSREVRGIAGVVDESGHLIGAITDGDIRRKLEKSGDPLAERAESMMSLNPKTIDKNEMAERALFLMEQFMIQALFVVDAESNSRKPVGLLHLQDLLKAKIR